MTTITKTIRIAVFSAAALWLAHSLVEALCIESLSFTDALLLKIPLGDLVFRLFLLGVIILIAGLSHFRPWERRKGMVVDIQLPPSKMMQLTPDTKHMIDQFIHEVRTQLNSIVGFSQLLDRGASGDKERSSYLNYIDYSKRNIGKAIDRLYIYLRNRSRKESREQASGILVPGKWKSKTILIVDDVEANFVLLKMALQKSGAEIIWAQNGKAAVDLFRQKPGIDLVLMDILMPEMDGMEATRKIKEVRSDVPVIAQTAYSYDEMVLSESAAPFDGYLIKPIWHVELFSKCAKYLDRKA